MAIDKAPYFILVGDGNNSQALTEALRKVSQPVQPVHDVARAIQMVEDREPALVIFASSKLSLADLCDALQDRDKSFRVPILVVESASDDLDRVTSNGYTGWVENLQHSFSPEFFHAKILTYLKMDQVRDVSKMLDDRQQSVEKEKEELKEKLGEAQNLSMLGRLASGVAHDFNNILGGILGYAELTNLRFGNTAPEVNKYTRAIMNFTKRASELTKEILSFSTPGKNQSEVFDAHQLISEVVDLLSHLIDKKFQIEKNLLSTVPLLKGDPSQLQNALVNLALNARDAMPEGGKLRFTTESVEVGAGDISELRFHMEAGPHLKLTVEDTGTGMEADTLSKIFEPFFTTKERGKGTGLGLPSVLHAVKSFKGGIRVASVSGKGTRFELFLPLSSKQEMNAPPTAEIAVLKGNGTILVVDDEEALLEIISEMLKDAGYRVITAKDGLEALEYYKIHQSEIDLVLMDLNLPKMTGRNIFLEFKKINPEVKAILSTGFSMNEEAKSAMRSGMMAFIQKPFEMSQLLKAIAKVLNR